ncbi:hypothetical protein U0070_021062 [Myodes glareolus]|uniref:Uncharacterized protein n=1 Tax=Myodes glareolus TaxID=447135 RepID=A0AAW0HGZ0_MYOGA
MKRDSKTDSTIHIRKNLESNLKTHHSPGPGGTYCTVSGEAQVGKTLQDTQVSQRISFKMKKVESLPIAQCNSLHSTTFVSGNKSSPFVFSFCKDSEKTPRPFLSGADNEPSQVMQTQSEIKPPSETLQRKFTDTPSLSGTVLEQEKETQEVLLLNMRTSVQNPGAHSHQAKSVSEFPQSVEKESTSQPQGYTTVVLLPEHPRSTLLLADTLASQELGDIVMVGGQGDKSLVQQKPSTPKHRVSLKTSQIPPESSFQKPVICFLQWIHPTQTIKGQESAPKIGQPTAATAQMKMKPPMNRNVAEALEFMPAIEQLLKNNMMQQCQSFPRRKVEHPATHPIPIAKVFYKGEAHARPTISEKCTIYQGSTDSSASQPLAPEHSFEFSTFLSAWNNSESIIERTENLFHVKNLGPILGKISKDSNRYLEKISSKVTRGKSFGDRKANQLTSDLSECAMILDCYNDVFSMSSIQMETKDLASSKSTHQALEEHIVRFQVKHRWGKPLKLLKPINKNFFKMKKNFTDTPSQSGIVLVQKRETKEVLLLPIMTSVQNPEANSHQAKTVSEFPQSVEKESASQP